MNARHHHRPLEYINEQRGKVLALLGLILQEGHQTISDKQIHGLCDAGVCHV